MIEVWGKKFQKGERGMVKQSVATQLNGFEIYITAHVVCCKEDGPVLGLTWDSSQVS